MSFFLTFNPHPNDINKFNDFLHHLIPSIMTFPKYIMVIEKNETPDAHFHAIVVDDTIRDSEKFCQKLRPHIVKAYKMYNHTETGKSKLRPKKFEEPAWKVISFGKDKEKLIDRVGYLYKEIYNETRQTNLSLDYLLDCYKTYHINEKVKLQQQDLSGYDEWKLVVVNNAHITINHHIKTVYKEKMNLTDDQIDRIDIVRDMRRYGYSFVKITEKQLEVIFADLRDRKLQKTITHFTFTDPEPYSDEKHEVEYAHQGEGMLPAGTQGHDVKAKGIMYELPDLPEDT